MLVGKLVASEIRQLRIKQMEREKKYLMVRTPPQSLLFAARILRY